MNPLSHDSNPLRSDPPAGGPPLTLAHAVPRPVDLVRGRFSGALLFDWHPLAVQRDALRHPYRLAVPMHAGTIPLPVVAIDRMVHDRHVVHATTVGDLLRLTMTTRLVAATPYACEVVTTLQFSGILARLVSERRTEERCAALRSSLLVQLPPAEDVPLIVRARAARVSDEERATGIRAALEGIGTPISSGARLVDVEGGRLLIDQDHSRWQRLDYDDSPERRALFGSWSALERVTIDGQALLIEPARGVTIRSRLLRARGSSGGDQ